MEQIRNFIDLVAQGQNVEAKSKLEDLISSRAFEALDSKKQELASGLFGSMSEEVESVNEAAPKPVNKQLTQHFAQHYGHVYDDEQSEASKIYSKVSKTHGKKVADDMVTHSNHAYDASFRRGKERAEAEKKAMAIRNKHGIDHDEI